MALLLFLLPALAFARIDIEISGEFDPSRASMGVHFSGSEVGVISDAERNTFSLGDDNLKYGIETYFGRRPSDAYLRSPTPHGDLYKTYGWDQVLRTLRPKSGKILSITSEPTIVMKQEFENNSSLSGVFNVAIHHQVDNTYTSSWSKKSDLTIGQEIKYEIDIEVAKAGGKTSMSYTSSFGTNTEKSQKVTVGSTSEVNVVLKPGQAVLAELQATKGSIRVEVEYEASLQGAVAVDYDDTYKGHHFWSLDVRAVLNALGMDNSLRYKEIIEIGFFSNSAIVVKDKVVGNRLLEAQF